jgi:hypothetical protein
VPRIAPYQLIRQSAFSRRTVRMSAQRAWPGVATSGRPTGTDSLWRSSKRVEFGIRRNWHAPRSENVRTFSTQSSKAHEMVFSSRQMRSGKLSASKKAVKPTFRGRDLPGCKPPTASIAEARGEPNK